MKAAEALLTAANGGTAAPRAAPSAAPDTSYPPGMQLQCDVNGCSIVAVPHTARAPPPAAGVADASFLSSVTSMDSSDEDAGPKSGRGGGAAGAGPPRDFDLAEGAGWRLGVDRSAPPGGPGYCAVVGGDGWSAALTRDEYDDLVKVREKTESEEREGEARARRSIGEATTLHPTIIHFFFSLPFLTPSFPFIIFTAAAQPAKVGGHPARVRGLAGILGRRRCPGDEHGVRVGAGAGTARAVWRRRGGRRLL